MVEQKWFGDKRKNQCLKRRDQAKSSGDTFTSFVTIGGPNYKYYISVYGSKVSHYRRLGRVLVNYNSKTHTWHCPCIKCRKSCLHKSIAKWCLFQMKRQLFTTLPQAEAETDPSQHEDPSGQQWEYPPESDAWSRRYSIHTIIKRFLTHYQMFLQKMWRRKIFLILFLRKSSALSGLDLFVSVLLSSSPEILKWRCSMVWLVGFVGLSVVNSEYLIIIKTLVYVSVQ